MTPNSGSPAYNYLWDNGEITAEAFSLSGGWHTVEVSDTRGCTVVDSVNIPENPIIESNLIIDYPVSCFGHSDGIASISTTGGASYFYTYFWSHQISQIDSVNFYISDSLSHGGYYVITRDSIGCIVIDSIYLSHPDPLYVDAQEVLEVSCYGDSTGTAFASGYGGTLPYTFDWINNAIIDSSSNDSSLVATLFAGLDTVQLTDARGCVATDTVTINQPDLLVASISDSILAYCVGVNTASATAGVSGGTAPYTFEWDDNLISPQTSAVANSLEAGIYTVTVTDYRGCQSSVSADLTLYSDPLITTINPVSVSCYGSSDGALTVVPQLGTSPYTYQWVGSSVTSTNSSIFNLSEGVYSVTVTDANGCIANSYQQLTAPAPLLYQVLSTANTVCLGACDGELALNIQGGVSPYIAQLINNQSAIVATNSVDANSLVTGVCTGDYTVLVKDNNNCDAVLIFGGSDQAILDTTITTDVTVAVTQDINCYGDYTGEVNVITPQTDTLYSYIWLALNGDTVSEIALANNLPAGDYILYAEYNNITGCTTVDTVTVSQNSLIYSNAIVTNVSCNGGNDGSIITTTLGGVSPYVYLWSPLGATSSNAINVPSGSYDLTITDTTNDCSVIESYTVTAPALLTTTVTPSQTYILNASVVGGTSPYTYSWVEQTQTSVALGALSSYTVGSNGTYYVVVTDANNCTSQSNPTTYLETDILDITSSMDLSIYPNPFRNETTIDFGQRINKATIRIVDVYGKVVERYELADTDKYIIKRTNKASGVYFMEIEIAKIRLNSKIIIK